MISPYPNAKIDTEKEKDPYHKVTEYRKFNVNWAERDPDERINYRDK
jgi:hypothetical protein